MYLRPSFSQLDSADQSFLRQDALLQLPETRLGLLTLLGVSVDDVAQNRCATVRCRDHLPARGWGRVAMLPQGQAPRELPAATQEEQPSAHAGSRTQPERGNAAASLDISRELRSEIILAINHARSLATGRLSESQQQLVQELLISTGRLIRLADQLETLAQSTLSAKARTAQSERPSERAIAPEARPTIPPGQLEVAEPGLVLDIAARQVWRDRREVMLTRLEFDVLAYLAERRRQVQTRARLLAAVWGDRQQRISQRVVDLTVLRLRRKLGDNPRSPLFIETVLGVGYRFGGAVRFVSWPSAP